MVGISVSEAGNMLKILTLVSFVSLSLYLALRQVTILLQDIRMIPNLLYFIEQLGRVLETRIPPPTTSMHRDSGVTIYNFPLLFSNLLSSNCKGFVRHLVSAVDATGLHQ